MLLPRPPPTGTNKPENEPRGRLRLEADRPAGRRDEMPQHKVPSACDPTPTRFQLIDVRSRRRPAREPSRARDTFVYHRPMTTGSTTALGGRGRRFITNVLWNWMGTAASLFTGLILSPILIRKLGPDGYGVWALSFAMADYYWFFD